MLELMAPPKGFRHTQEAKRKIGEASKRQVRKPITEETRAKMRAAKLGKPAWNKGLPMWWSPARSKGKEPWNKGQTGLQVSSRRGVKQPHISGEKHWNWQGGITPKNKAARRSLEFKVWRKAVFERDNYICTCCGARNGNGVTVELHADHIKQFAYYPELRYDVSNGRTLCKPCHKKTETFSRKKPC